MHDSSQHNDDLQWTILLPVKRRTAAKTRLLAPDVSADTVAQVALAFALDTIAAIRSCRDVARLLVITDDALVAQLAAEGGAVIVSEESLPPDVRGFERLNAAIRLGERAPETRHPLAILTSDLPCLRGEELSAVLSEARQHARSFLADHTGVGTAMLCSTGVPLDPRFGVDSANEHARSGAVTLSAPVPSVRLDVDTAADLQIANSLGVGAHTRAVLHTVLRLPSTQ